MLRIWRLVGNEWSLHSLQPKFPPAEGSWGYPGTPEVLRKKSWGLEKRKRNSILSLKPACLHPWLCITLGSQTHTHLHMFTNTHSHSCGTGVYFQIHANTFTPQICSDS